MLTYLKNPYSIIFLCIFLLGLFLRVFSLSSVPIGIHGDEASIGYNAYSLLKTGRDQNNNLFPLSIDQFGDYRPAGYHYLAIPFVAILGLNELSTRLPAAIFGALTIIIIYFLLFELFQSRKISLIGSFLLAISPWHIAISRATSEGIIAAFFIILGVYLFLRASKEKNLAFKLLLLSFLSLSLSFLFYHSARFFVPMFFLFLIPITFFYYRQERKSIFSRIIFFGALVTLLIILFSAGRGASRPLNISVFNIPGGTTELKHQQDQDGTQNPLLTRYFHNKLYFYGRLFLTSYFQHFDGDYLFVNNGQPVRYRVPWTGNLYVIELPFLLLGFSILLAEGIKQKKLPYLIPIAWLFLAAIPAGLTWEDIPNIQRSSLMLYALIMIGTFGLSEVLHLVKDNRYILLSFIIVSGLILLQNVSYFLHNYFYHSKIHEPWHRSAAVKELVFTVEGLSKKYPEIVMTGEGNNNLIHYLFYQKFDPETFHRLRSPKEKDGFRFLNFVYSSNPCPLQGNPDAEEHGMSFTTIYVVLDRCSLPKNSEVLNVIRHPDGIPAYKIVKLINTKANS